MANLSRLAKLEIASNESRRQKKQRPLKDYSLLSDEDLKNLFNDEMVKLMATPSPEYEGLTDHQLSDIYMQSIQEGNRKNAKKLK